MPGLDNNVIVNVSGDSPPVASKGFGSVVVACSGLPAGFTERLRYYTDAASATADVDLTASARAAVAACFALTLTIPKIGIARIGLIAKVQTLTITVAADGTWTIAFTAPDGSAISATFVATGSAIATAIATGLRASLTTAVAGKGVTITGAAAEIIITTTTPGDTAFTTPVATPPAGGAATQAATAVGVTLAEELAAVAAVDSTWYGLHLESRNVALIRAASAYAEANKKLHVAQSSDAGIPAGTAGNIAAALNSLSYNYTAVGYHSTDSEWMQLTWLCSFLSANPDTTSTIAAYRTLPGITIGTFTAAEMTTMRAAKANFYTTFQSAGATWGGTVASGLRFDQRIARDWLKARCEEAIAQTLINASNSNSKVPFTAAGLERLRGVIANVGTRGVDAGHFSGDTKPVTTTITPAGADKANRQARYRMVCTEAGSIELVTLDANIVV